MLQYGKAQGYQADVANALVEDRDGSLWIGTRDGLQRFRNGVFSLFTTQDGLSDNRINALCPRAKGGLWIGTDAGLTCWSEGVFTNLSAGSRVPREVVLSLYEDAGGGLWIGTRGAGLWWLRDGRLEVFSLADGLFSDSIYAILEDSHANLWLAGSKGIFRLAKEQLAATAQDRTRPLTSISFGKADGIISSGQHADVTQPSACKGVDGRLWFRTTQGVAVTDPDKITTNELPPPLAVARVLADRRLVCGPGAAAGPASNSPDKHARLVIPPGRGELEIHYAALSFRAPEKNRFRYQLAPADSTWIDAGDRRTAFYNNLPPGRYLFRVTACNNDGVWNPDGVSLTLLLLPHFWQTWWFSALVVSGAAGAVAGTVRSVTRRKMMRKLERLERQHAIEKERARIARDMHDELGAKLTRISFQGATATRSLGNPEEARHQIETISHTARALVSSLDEIVWAVDPENDSLENLVSYLCRFAGDLFENSPISCQLDIPPTLPAIRLTADTRHNLFSAVKEALNNAAKHSGGSTVRLAISVREGRLQILISDNGRGLPRLAPAEDAANKRRGHGLANLRGRLAAIHGTFSIEPASGGGTTVRLTVRLPLPED